MTDQERNAMQMALKALENNRRNHYYCEDTWYSCPKHEDGCANDSEGNECNCGADKANQEIESAIAALRQALAQPEQDISYTDIQMEELIRWGEHIRSLRTIEAALKEKNT